MQETGTLWDKCSVVDIGRVQPQRNEECLRQRCVSHVAMSLLVYLVNVHVHSYMLLGMQDN